MGTSKRRGSAARRPQGEPPRWGAPALLLALAFLSPGAWLVTSLPPVPIAKALNLASVGVWLLVFGLGAAVFARPERRVRLALGGAGLIVLAAYLAGGSLFEVAFYDLFGNMPLVTWLAFPAVFILAAGSRWEDGAIVRALEVVVAIGTLQAFVMAYQRQVTGDVAVFGSTAYVVTALVPLVPSAIGLAAERRGGVAPGWYAPAFYSAATVISLALVLGSGSGTGALAVAFAVLVSVAIHPAPGRMQRARWDVVRRVALVLAGVLVAGALFVQVPALSRGIAGPEQVESLGKNVASRAYLWEGAQAMVADRPLLGFGPSGYRTFAADYLDPAALQFGPDQAGNTDPTVYSPMSPHSVLWEIATRLGVLGLLAFAALFAAWGGALRGRARSEHGLPGVRAALAAGFCSALVALLVNPAYFAIGLFGAVAAGLAIAPGPGRADGSASAMWVRHALAVAGIATIGLALWLGIGEVRLAQARVATTAPESIAGLESTLRTLPRHPLATRGMLELRLLTAADDAAVATVHGEVDGAPRSVTDFRPNLVNLVAFSLAQAERTGRTDVSWELDVLQRASNDMPPFPSLAAERLHAAVVSGDTAAVAAWIADAELWGGPYAYTETYLEQARALLNAGTAP